MPWLKLEEPMSESTSSKLQSNFNSSPPPFSNSPSHSPRVSTHFGLPKTWEFSSPTPLWGGWKGGGTYLLKKEESWWFPMGDYPTPRASKIQSFHDVSHQYQVS